jgi:V/A-type H+-transporting ATPase subunit I
VAALGFEEVVLPSLLGKVRDHIRELRADLAESEERLASVVEKVRALVAWRRPLLILRNFWMSHRNRQLAATKGVYTKWVQVLSGYIRAQDVPKLEATFRREFPDATVRIADPAPDEDVPVSITLPRFVKPIQLLINMFGLPHYATFDPSPFLVFNFYIFFGICFSDVGYGLMLIALSLYLIAKTRNYEGLNGFARLLLYAGVATVVFGAMLGSWFGDLYKPEYLGEAKPIHALAIALGIGMLNQWYGIALKIYGAARRRDWSTAFCDGVLWLIALPGLTVVIGGAFVPVPPVVSRIGIGMFALGALGLVLTQGRGNKNPLSRFLVGLVSLYGILGSYGCTAFIGDTLSYCRLLALGLTTSIVAMSFNMMADMLKAVPYVGIVLFVALIVLGHVFNFLISVLGAFVHSMRLVFVEFFGRFYAGGARPFQPLGFDSPGCVLKKTAGSP